MAARVPDEIRTERLLLRRWRADDAEPLLPILEANFDHLKAWIPLSVASPAPVPELAVRLKAWDADFETGLRWRFCIATPDDRDILGEVSLFPRDAERRVPIESADRVEIGYWVRNDLTGRGIATEVTRAMIDLSGTLGGMKRIEIRCDDRNAASAAIPRRLGFRLLLPDSQPADTHDMVWYLDVEA
jgi:RimJ/RimL family protein N-acetyltransferase